MSFRIRAAVLTMAVAGALVLPVSVASAAADATTTNERVPLAQPVFIPCADGGAGEDVLIEGTLHLLAHTTVDSSGGAHVRFHAQPQGASGTGMITGDTYHATGVTQGELNVKVGVQDTFINNFRIIGEGPGNNFLIHEVIHLTVNANGEVTAEVVQLSVDCK